MCPEFTDYLNEFDIISCEEIKLDNLDEIYLDQHQCFQKTKQKKKKKKNNRKQKLKANLAVSLSLSETIYVNILLLLKQIANMYYGSKCQNVS